MTPTTSLEAINLMLSMIGEAPVNDLDTASTSDVSTAIRTLNEVNREVQTFGWIFNTEKEVTLPKDNSGYINIPLDAARVEVSRSLYSDCDPVQRGERLYDRKNRTFVFTRNIVAEKLVTLLPYEDLPQSAKHFISIRAARRFAARVQGAETTQQFSAQDEMFANRTLLKEQAEQSDLNILNAPGVRDVLNRGRGRWVS